MREHHRPSQPGDAFFDAVEGGSDPALAREAGDLAATLLVRGAGESHDAGVAERIVRLAETEGLETLADVWAGAPADTLAGCLWRLYVLRAWVHRAPVQVAREYDAGRSRAQVARVVAGVADPPDPDALTAMVDEVLRGIAGGDFAVTLLRAAAFARVVATGRAVLEGADHAAAAGADPDTHRPTDIQATSRMLALAEQLEHAGHLELAGSLA
jgi:hypothetical protein